MVCRNCENPVATHPVVSIIANKKLSFNLCDDCYSQSVILCRPDLCGGAEFAWYTAQLHQRPYHEADETNLLALGTRGTGKSTMMRKDAIIRCMQYPGFKALIIRRKIPDLQMSHLRFINAEMKLLDPDGTTVGYYRSTTHDVMFKNGSFIQFSHCETLKDVENYLSSEWDLIVFDELSTFTLEMFLKISAAARSPEDAPYRALVRAGSNPLGIGAQWMKSWFIDRDVDLVEFPDYLPEDFAVHFSMLDQNRYVNRKDYEKRLRNLPEHVRRAWLHGEFVVEGAYFSDFKKRKDIIKPNGTLDSIDWHCIQALPTWKGIPLSEIEWISVYRSIDWGYFPDPAVCHWHIVLPNKRKITFKERTWRKTLAADVAKQIKRESQSMHVVETFCDPTMFVKDGAAPFSIGEIFEQNGVPLVPSQNNRELYGYAVHELLNTPIKDENGQELPSWQILEPACPELVRTIPILQMDATDSRKIANGPDHWVISCAYFGMGGAPPSHNPVVSTIPRWMQPKAQSRIIGYV
jgi:hypothetical protein